MAKSKKNLAPPTIWPPTRPEALAAPSFGPYVGLWATVTRVFEFGKKKRTFHVLGYGAYNAFGLIGSECNGLVVLDEDKRQVLTDEVGKLSSGYYGPSDAQIDEITKVKDMPWLDFARLVNGSPRCRKKLDFHSGELISVSANA